MAIEYLCIYRQWDDSISTAILKRASLPLQTTDVSSLFRGRKRKERERFHWPKSSPWRGREKRDGAQGNGESYTYLRTVRGYTWQSAYRSPQEMRYSWESYVAETEADTRDRDTREPIWIETPYYTRGREGWKCEETTAWDGQVNETWEELRGVDGGVQKGVCDSPTCRFRRKEGNGWPLSETISDFFHALCNILGNINEYHVVIIFV